MRKLNREGRRKSPREKKKNSKNQPNFATFLSPATAFEDPRKQSKKRKLLERRRHQKNPWKRIMIDNS